MSPSGMPLVPSPPQIAYQEFLAAETSAEYLS
jgi:hypothetical protein